MPTIAPKPRTIAATVLVAAALNACGDNRTEKVHEAPSAGYHKISEHRLAGLQRGLARYDFDLDQARKAVVAVPPVFVVRLPADLDEIADAAGRKQLFIKMTLPMILRVNQHIQSHRRIFDDLRAKTRGGTPLNARQQRQLAKLAEIYETAPKQLDELDRRIGPIPPSLALAQAAIESGWGTSRFAIRGNALFGERIFSNRGGIQPRGTTEDANFQVRKFPSLLRSVWAYARNLNTHPSYTDLRTRRAAIRANGAVSGEALSHELSAYSEKGAAYGDLIRRVIRSANLAPFDRATLADQRS